MKLFRQLAIILLILFIGELLSRGLKLPIPGNVIGMIILLLALITHTIKLEMLEHISKFLLDHLAFFFIPAGVALLVNIDTIRNQWLPILGVIFISTTLVIITTGLTVQWLRRKLN